MTFRVADNGAGIAEADRARVTERFVRLEESRSKPGAGLGLSLVSAVAQLHGGKLVLTDNNPGLAAILTRARCGCRPCRLRRSANASRRLPRLARIRPRRSSG